MIPAIIVGTLAAAAAYTFTGDNLVSSKEAKKLIRSGNIKKVIDVRTITEYRAGHYRGAIHIPVRKLPRNSQRRVCSSTATLGNEPDLRQRN